MLSPDGYIKLSWDLLCMVLIFYEILTIPLKISFEIEINETWDTIVDLIFITDIILTFNTAFYKNGK